MSEPGVTIAIPNWNHELLLPRSVSSALRAIALLKEQGMPGEVIVIDDFSRDGSLTLLRQLEALYSRYNFRVLAFGANAGLAASRNQALAHARYRYIAFLDADNELIPENLPILLETLEQTRAAAAYGNLLVRSAASTCAHHVLSNESMQGRIFQGNYVDAFSVFDRLQLLDAGGYESTFHALEDLELWQHLASNGRRIVFVPVVLGYYYALPVSMGRDDAKDQAVGARILRIFNQVGARPKLPINTNQLRYHPEIGYI
jgi:glycosyltransferase involved in cell wall biosynthesis